MKNEKKNANQVTVQVRVSKGIAQFIQDHSTYLKERYGASNLQEYIEQIIPEDFEATVDHMHLNVEEIRNKYAIRGESEWPRK